ncbi:hypothetical protein KA047_02420 [Candidatus Saccharibacteria bacterium]|nr:hypothetical protein [Candidatus Saccharibacteria bacterium]
MPNSEAPRKKLSALTKTFWLSILAGFLLLISNSAIWVNNYIFDDQNFSSVVTTAITSESSRTAIAESVTNKVFADRPVLKKVAGDVSTNIISGLLGTTQANNAISEVVQRLNVLVTSNSPQPVVLDLSGVKNILTQLVDVSTSLGREPKVNPDSIPSEITLLDTDNLPNFYRFSVAFLWMAPLAFIGALASIAYPYIKPTRQFKPMLLMQGAVVTAFGLLALLVGPLFRPPLLANVDTSQGRVVIGNIYDGFITTFNTQSRYLLGLGVLMMLVSAAMYVYQIVIPSMKQRQATRQNTAKPKVKAKK